MAVLKMDMSERDCGGEIGGGKSWEDVMAFVETRMKNLSLRSTQCSTATGKRVEGGTCELKGYWCL